MNCEMPEAYGGLGLTCLAHCLVLEEISYGCTGVNTTLAANMLGTMPLIIAGTDAQKKEYFGRLLAKPIFAAYCCSEPDAGSDVAGMKSRYRKVGDDYVHHRPEALDHQRRRRRASTPCSRARRGPTRHKGDHLLRRRPRHARACRSARRRTRWGSAASNTTDVIFEEVKVGKANIVGAEGEGFKVAMRTFDRTRPWIAAGAAGIIRRCARRMPQVRAGAQDLRRADRAAPGGAVHARRDGHRLRDDAPALPQGRLGDRQRQARQHRLQLRQGLRRRRRHARVHRRRPDLRRLRLHQGVSGREADARRQAAADLRRHQPDPAHGHRAQRARR